MSYNANPPQYPYHGNNNRNAPIPRPAQDVRYVNSQNPSQSPYPAYPQQGNSLRQQQMMPSQLPQQMPNHMSQQMSSHMSSSMSQQQIAPQKPIQQQQQQQQMVPQKPLQSVMQIPSQNQPSQQQQQMSQQMLSQKPIAPPQSSLSAPYSRATISELVLVPTELSSFAADPQFQQTLLKVKEQTLINFISLNRITENSVESVAIDAPTKESAQLARNLIETHFKLQQKLMTAESRLKKVETEFFSAQGEIASGMMVEFSIPSDLIGLIIGKKGARIKQIEQDTGVNSINVNGETGRITVNGPDSTSVQRAREMLELHEESLELSQLQTDWLNNKNNLSTLADIKSVSNLMLTRINSANNTLDVVGVIAAVRSAKLMLATQLEYIDKQIEIESSEKNIREQLSAVRKQYGIGHNQYSNKQQQGGDRGDRGNYSNSNSNNNGQYVKQQSSSQQQHGGNYNDRNDRYQNQHDTQRGHDNRQQGRQQNASAGPSRGGTAASSDSVQTLPIPPPVRNAPQQKSAVPPVKGVATNSRNQGADIDSIIGHTSGASTTANKPTAAALATHMSHEQFLSAAVTGASSGRQVQVVKAQAPPESGANRDISNVNNPNNSQYRKQQQGGNNAGTNNNRSNQQQGGNKVPVHNHQNQKSSSATPAASSQDAAPPPLPLPIVTLSGGLLITAPVATTASSTDVGRTNNNNRNNNRNRNKNHAETATVTSVTASVDASSAQIAGSKHSNQQPAKHQQQAKSRTVTDVQQPAAQPMLLQLLQDQKKAAPVVTNTAVEGETKKNNRNQNNKNNNKSGSVSAVSGGVLPAEERLKDLLSHVSVVSVVNGGGDLTGALAALKVNDSAVGGPPPKNNNNRNNNRNNQNRAKAAPAASSSEGGNDSSSAHPAAASPAATSTPAAAVSAAAVVVDALPKRAKRNPGSSAVVADASSAPVSGLSLGGGKTSSSAAAPAVTPPPGIAASASAASAVV